MALKRCDVFKCVFVLSVVLMILGQVVFTAAQEDRGEPDELWILVEQPRCCSDCTYTTRGFKCKQKSCLTKCPFPPKHTSTSEPEEDMEDATEDTSTPVVPEGESFS